MNTEETQTAYLHLGGPFTDKQPATRLTVNTKAQRRPLWWHKRNLSFTRSGYGRRIPTEWVVMYNGRWQRVYCCIFSNSGTCYIEHKRKPVATVDL